MLTKAAGADVGVALAAVESSITSFCAHRNDCNLSKSALARHFTFIQNL